MVKLDLDVALSLPPVLELHFKRRNPYSSVYRDGDEEPRGKLMSQKFVPMVLIEKISHMKRSNAFKIIKTLLKFKLVVHCSKNCTTL